jgi:hypothetical protein
VDSTPSDKELEVSRKKMVVLDISWVNLMEGCWLLARERKFCISSSLWVHFISTSSINLYQEIGNQYLLPSSYHPPHVTKSIPYSQALRIRRICSTDKFLKKWLDQLKNNSHQQVSQTVWLFEGNHGRLRKDFEQFGIFFDGCPMPTNGIEAVSQTRMVCEDTRGSFT